MGYSILSYMKQPTNKQFDQLLIMSQITKLNNSMRQMNKPEPFTMVSIVSINAELHNLVIIEIKMKDEIYSYINPLILCILSVIKVPIMKENQLNMVYLLLFLFKK